MGREHRLHRRSGAGGQILPGYPKILADPAGRRTDAELFRYPAEDRATGSRYAGFPDPGATRSRRPRADQPVRHRVAGTDVVPGDRRPCRWIGRGVNAITSASLHSDERISAHPAVNWWLAVLVWKRVSGEFRWRYAASTARSHP